MNWNQSNNNLFLQSISFRWILHYGSGLTRRSSDHWSLLWWRQSPANKKICWVNNALEFVHHWPFLTLMWIFFKLEIFTEKTEISGLIIIIKFVCGIAPSCCPYAVIAVIQLHTLWKHKSNNTALFRWLVVVYDDDNSQLARKSGN